MVDVDYHREYIELLKNNLFEAKCKIVQLEKERDDFKDLLLAKPRAQVADLIDYRERVDRKLPEPIVKHNARSVRSIVERRERERFEARLNDPIPNTPKTVDSLISESEGVLGRIEVDDKPMSDRELLNVGTHD